MIGIYDITNIEVAELNYELAQKVHAEAVQIRKDYNIEDNHIKLCSGYIIYPLNDKYYSVHYIAHIDNKYDRFFITVMKQCTEDEYLDSISKK
jgi:hypothetical protein